MPSAIYFSALETAGVNVLGTVPRPGFSVMLGHSYSLMFLALVMSIFIAPFYIFGGFECSFFFSTFVITINYLTAYALS